LAGHGSHGVHDAPIFLPFRALPMGGSSQLEGAGHIDQDAVTVRLESSVGR
jgi:hypothetical protein